MTLGVVAVVGIVESLLSGSFWDLQFYFAVSHLFTPEIPVRPMSDLLILFFTAFNLS